MGRRKDIIHAKAILPRDQGRHMLALIRRNTGVREMLGFYLPWHFATAVRTLR